MAILRSLVVGVALAELACVRPVNANENPFSFLSTASTNSTLVAPGGQFLRSVLIVNTTATTYYLKLYDTVSAPTCGVGAPKMRIPIPPQANGGGVIPLSWQSLQFVNGVGFCLVGAIADNDTSNAATGVALNFTLSQL